jgi:hypothetical protein
VYSCGSAYACRMTQEPACHAMPSHAVLCWLCAGHSQSSLPVWAQPHRGKHIKIQQSVKQETIRLGVCWLTEHQHRPRDVWWVVRAELPMLRTC